MSIFQLVSVIIYATSVLTSTVNDTSIPDPSTPSDLKKLFVSSSSLTGIKDPTDTRSVNGNVSTSVSKSENKVQILSEGGGHIPFPKSETTSSTKPAGATEDTSLPADKLPESPKPSESSKGIVARKGVEPQKIFGKKGVKYPEDSDNEKSTTPTDPEQAEQAVTEKDWANEKKTSTTEKTPVLKTEPTPKSKENADMKITNNTELDKKPETNATKTMPIVFYVPPGPGPNITVTQKKKPTSTTGEGDDDGKGIGMPSHPTQADIGMPRKVDYIIPVVITIMATPILGIAAFVLYTRGRDCWEKRHYRRMDFLIDGMYND